MFRVSVREETERDDNEKVEQALGIEFQWIPSHLGKDKTRQQDKTRQDKTRQDKTTQHNTTQHNTTQHNARQHKTTQDNTRCTVFKPG